MPKCEESVLFHDADTTWKIDEDSNHSGSSDYAHSDNVPDLAELRSVDTNYINPITGENPLLSGNGIQGTTVNH